MSEQTRGPVLTHIDFGTDVDLYDAIMRGDPFGDESSPSQKRDDSSHALRRLIAIPCADYHAFGGPL